MKIKPTNTILGFNEDGLSFTLDETKSFDMGAPRMKKIVDEKVKEMVVQPKRKQSKSVTLF